MVIRFREVEDIVDAFKKAGYIETNNDYISPFHTFVFPPGHYDLRLGEYEKSWILEQVKKKDGIRYVKMVALIGESIAGYVDVHLFGPSGIEIPSSKRTRVDGGKDSTEKIYWIGTEIQYYINKNGLERMNLQRIERLSKTVDEVHIVFRQDVDQQISQMHKVKT
ncbi:MAG TPA: hypothetical protein VJJ76_01265 [archaeon]|nr:hypothetical protein [archaeon]